MFIVYLESKIDVDSIFLGYGNWYDVCGIIWCYSRSVKGTYETNDYLIKLGRIDDGHEGFLRRLYEKYRDMMLYSESDIAMWWGVYESDDGESLTFAMNECEDLKSLIEGSELKFAN
jgi:hypothetical protein